MGGLIRHWLRLILGWPLVIGLALAVIFWPWPAPVQKWVHLGIIVLFLLGVFISHLMSFWDMGRKIGRDHQAGFRWWRNPSLSEAFLGMGLLLFIGALFANLGAAPMWLVCSLPVLAIAAIFGIILRRVVKWRQSHPESWRQIVRDEWRRCWKSQLMGSCYSDARVLMLVEKFDPADSKQREVLLISALRSDDKTIKALAGNALWNHPETKELGRPLLEEAAAAGEELAAMILRRERLEKCDLENPELVQALVEEAMTAPKPDLAYDLGMRLVHTEHVGLGKKLLNRVIVEGDDIQIVQAKLACLDYDDVEAVEAMADEAYRQKVPYLAMFLGMRIRFHAEHKVLGRELMVWASEKDPEFRKSLQSGDDHERILACDLGDPEIRSKLADEATARDDDGSFAVTLACSLWSHDAETSRRLLLWAESQGHDYARRMLEDFEKTSDPSTAGGTPAIQ